MTDRGGPLNSLRIVELGGIGPGPFAGMVLADLGAEVIRLDRPGVAGGGAFIAPEHNLLLRGRRSLVLDLRVPNAVEAVLKLVETADATIEGFRPGVMERLGLGPADCIARNPRLVYGRITGWGQDGPLATAAGHDLNYIALTGVLNAIGRAGERPVPPLNLVGDFGGGGMLLALGIVCGILEARSSGRGQVVDAAVVDGTALLATLVNAMLADGLWRDSRGGNFLDGGAPFYDVYETSDGLYVSVGPLEPQFYRILVDKLGLDQNALPDQLDPAGWPVLRERFAEAFRTKTRADWIDELEGSDACFAPVLDFAEAMEHPHNRARASYVEVDGVFQPAPAPRFSRTPGAIRNGPPTLGADTAAILAELGYSSTEIATLSPDDSSIT